MASPFSEAELVERPAMDLLAFLGWAKAYRLATPIGSDPTKKSPKPSL